MKVHRRLGPLVQRLSVLSAGLALLVPVSISNGTTPAVTVASALQGSCPTWMTSEWPDCLPLPPTGDEELDSHFSGDYEDDYRFQDSNCENLYDRFFDIPHMYTTDSDEFEAKWFRDNNTGDEWILTTDIMFGDADFNLTRRVVPHEAAHSFGCEDENHANAWADYCGGEIGEPTFDINSPPPPPCQYM